MKEPTEAGVRIETGDPSGKCPASFTRFALPFVWSLEDHDGRSDYIYRPSEPIADDRRKYFSPETADALFDRARWLTLQHETSTEAGAPFATTTLFVGRKRVEIAIAMPQLVLFEAVIDSDAPPILRTGVLLVEISFPQPLTSARAPTFSDLLIINERFRYWRCPFEDHLDLSSHTPSGPTSYRALFRDLRATETPGVDPYFDWWEALLRYPAEIGGRRVALVSKQAIRSSRAWKQNGPKTRSQDDPFGLGWIAHTDERAFVWTCAITEEGAHDSTLTRTLDPVRSAGWIHLLNVDAGESEPSDFEHDWAVPRTYTRWKHLRTLYGFTTHSGAMLSAACKEPPEPPAWQHFHTLYFDEVLLLLFLRISLFRFELKLSKVSESLAREDWTGDIEEFRRLRAAFSFLTNLYRFPLLSSQQQGIEMYAYMRNALDINELFAEVQEEIKTTHEMYELSTTSRMGEATAFLSIIVMVLGAVTTVLAFLAGGDAGDWLLAYVDVQPWFQSSCLIVAIAFVVSLALGFTLALRWKLLHWPRRTTAVKRPK